MQPTPAVRAAAVAAISVAEERDAIVVAAVGVVAVEEKARVRKQHITPKKRGKGYHMKRETGSEKSVTGRVNKEEPSAVSRRCRQNN